MGRHHHLPTLRHQRGAQHHDERGCKHRDNRWVYDESGAGIFCDPQIENDLKVSIVRNHDGSNTSTVHFIGDGTASQYYSFTANLSADGQTLTGGIVGKAAARIRVQLNAPQVASACTAPPAPPPAALYVCNSSTYRCDPATAPGRGANISSCLTTCKRPSPPPPAASVRVYPLPAHVTKTPLGVGGRGPISIDAGLAVSSVRSLTAPFGAAVLARYQLLLRNKASARIAQSHPLRLTHVVVDVPSDADTTLGPRTNESYTLSFALVPGASATVTATVASATIFGARHGLETLAQLVEAPAGIIPEAVAIVDGPVYPYRGLMIDSARHFLPLSLIRHAIDGLAALKMNVLHWHLIDRESFPIASQAFPQLSAAGAFSAAATYTLDELRAIVAYARQRGVRIIPEIEMPGHGSFSAGMPELATSSCHDVLDPTRNSTYAFLAAFLAEMATVFDDELVYLGGDEVGVGEACTFNGKHYGYCGYHCFDTDPAVAAWMAAQKPRLNSSELLQYFWQQVSERVLPGLDRTAGVWMSDQPCPVPEFLRPDMTKLPAGSVANVYQDWQAAAPLLDAGTPVVLSIAYDDWYLDYRPTFADVYAVRPCDAAHLDCDAHPRRRALLRGGSASMWGETVDATNWDSTVWPGTTALAERLWSDPPTSTATAADAEARHHALACHWKMWGIPTLTRFSSSSSSTSSSSSSMANGRPGRGSNYVSVSDAKMPACPADWCAVPP